MATKIQTGKMTSLEIVCEKAATGWELAYRMYDAGKAIEEIAVATGFQKQALKEMLVTGVTCD